MARKWLDHADRFLFGKHRGQSLMEVAEIDLGYLGWVLHDVEDVDPDDRDNIQEMYDYGRLDEFEDWTLDPWEER